MSHIFLYFATQADMFLIELFVNMFMCLRLADNDDHSFGVFQAILLFLCPVEIL